jgi:hypothetical protein
LGIKRARLTAEFGYLQIRRLTPLEVKIWISALIVTIILGILFITKVVGTWVVLTPGVLAMGVGLMLTVRCGVGFVG